MEKLGFDSLCVTVFKMLVPEMTRNQHFIIINYVNCLIRYGSPARKKRSKRVLPRFPTK